MTSSAKKGVQCVWKEYSQAFIISLILFTIGFYGGIKSSINDNYLEQNGVLVGSIVSSSQYVPVTIKIGYWQNSIDYYKNSEKYTLVESSFLQRHNGEKVLVVYDSQNPSNARVHDSWPSGWMSYFIGVVGLIPSLFFLAAELLGFIASRL